MVWRAVLTLVLAIYGYRCLRSPGDYRWLDSLDLAIHETGHLLFGFAGETIMLLGGSLFQLLVPAAFAIALWRAGDRHGATVPLRWMGQNCWNISVYVRDARAQELPLVGGGEHDWAILLANWDWLSRDQALADAVHLLGVVLYVVAIIGGWLLLRRKPGTGSWLEEQHQLLSSLGSEAKRSGRSMTRREKSEWAGLIRKLLAEGMMALGTRSTSDLPSAAQLSPMAWFSGGEGNRRHRFGSDFFGSSSASSSGNRMIATE